MLSYLYHWPKYQILMCSTAFFAFLRIGEITFSSIRPPPIQIQWMKCMRSWVSKLSLWISSTAIISPLISPQSIFCPVKILLHFLIARAPFLFRMMSPVSRSWFSTELSFAIKLCGLNPSVYKGQSFRIGAASHAAERGMSNAQIRILGRWKSKAFLKYIRVSSFSS